MKRARNVLVTAAMLRLAAPVLAAICTGALLPSAAAQPAPETPPPPPTGFAFGSYGRIDAATDLTGSTPEPVAVVAHGARIVEKPYLELDLYYHWISPRGVRVRTATTLAFGDSLFHYTGEFDAAIALRNFFLEAAIPGGLTLWAGSRMYRGDDIYLLDFWPLDDINTVGAGAAYSVDRLDLALHGGVNRLLQPFQYQEAEVSDPTFGATTIVQLDRQRMIASASAAYRFLGDGRGLSARAKLHAELHGLPAGDRERADETVESLPRDWGLVVGAQLGLWGFGVRCPDRTGAPPEADRSHANLFLRYARGLAAFDELSPPIDVDTSLRTFPRASELLLGLAANLELPRIAIPIGAYSRRFVDADRSDSDRDDGWEYVVDTRPQLQLAGDLHAAVDLSYQVRFPRGLSPTDLIARDPAVFQLAPMLIYAPIGRGTYARPQFRLVYRAAHLNEGARDLYPLEDPRRADAWVHYLGVQAEWWFNSTYR
jgi:LamB porin